MLCISSSSPPVQPAVSARMKWGLNGLSRLCHITCFFTLMIRLRPRLSRALLCLCFPCLINYQAAVHSNFFPKNGLIQIFRFFFIDSNFKKKSSFNGNSSLRKRRVSLKEPSQPPQKRKKTLRTSPPQPCLDLSFLTAEIHQRVKVNAEQTNDLFIACAEQTHEAKHSHAMNQPMFLSSPKFLSAASHLTIRLPLDHCL